MQMTHSGSSSLMSLCGAVIAKDPSLGVSLLGVHLWNEVIWKMELLMQKKKTKKNNTDPQSAAANMEL